MKIGVIGAQGFVGSAMAGYFKDNGHNVIGITRQNYRELRGSHTDILINANGNSRRYWADRNVPADFQASTASACLSLFDFHYGMYVYISSSDIYPFHGDPKRTAENERIEGRLLCPYGFHKLLSEQIVSRYCSKYLIARCSAMLGPGLKKGPVKDALDGRPLFITLDSGIQFIPARTVGEIIARVLEAGSSNETYNIGGVGAFDFRKLEGILKRKVTVSENAERQAYEMSVQKIARIFDVHTSESYLKEFLKTQEA